MRSSNDSIWMVLPWWWKRHDISQKSCSLNSTLDIKDYPGSMISYNLWPVMFVKWSFWLEKMLVECWEGKTNGIDCDVSFSSSVTRDDGTCGSSSSENGCSWLVRRRSDRNENPPNDSVVVFERSTDWISCGMDSTRPQIINMLGKKFDSSFRITNSSDLGLCQCTVNDRWDLQISMSSWNNSWWILNIRKRHKWDEESDFSPSSNAWFLRSASAW